MRRVKKNHQGCRPPKKPFAKGGFSPFSSADILGKKAKEQCCLGQTISGNVRQDGGTPTCCSVIADFFGVSEIAFLNPFPK